MESITLQSEISMSVVTADDREPPNEPPAWARSRSFLNETTRKYKINGEPVVLLLNICYSIYLSVSPLILFWARCVEIFGDFSEGNNGTEFCAKITLQNATKSLDIVETDVSNMSLYVQLGGTLATLIGAPIVGAWSDYIGRKKVQIFCILSLTVYTIIQIVGILLYKSVNIYILMFSAETFIGLTGGIAMPAIIASAIIVDDSRSKLLVSGIPLRIAIACVLRALGNIIGTFVYSLCAIPISVSSIHHIDGFTRSYFVALGCCLLALLYSFFCITETLQPTNSVSENNSSNQTVVGIGYLRSTCSVLFGKRSGWVRLCLFLLLFSMFIDYFNIDNGLLFLMMKRLPFAWSDEQFNTYLLLKNFLTIGGILLLPLSLKLFTCVGKDSLMLIVAILANALIALLLGVAKSTTIIYFATLFFFLGSGTIPGFLTLSSKMVAKDETARLFSIISLLYMVCPLFTKAILYKIYEFSLGSYPRLVFLVMAVLLFFTFIGQMYFFGIVHYLMHQQWCCVERPNETDDGCSNDSTVAVSSMDADDDDERPLIG